MIPCKALSTAATSLALVAFASGSNTYFVDDDGGPFADFTDIQSAIDTASSGDLIIVQRGTYAGFVLDRGLTILGSEFAPGATVTSHVQVQGVTPDEIAILSSLKLITMEVESSGGPVVLDNLLFDTPSGAIPDEALILVENCADVRLFECNATNDLTGHGPFSQAALRVRSSTCEVVSSELRGLRGVSSFFCGGDGAFGGSAVVSEAMSQTLVFLSTVQGGNGGQGRGWCGDFFFSNGGGGGHGIQGLTATDVMVAGLPENQCLGGTGGQGDGYFGQNGPAGSGLSIWLGASIRRSGVTVVYASISSGASDTQPVPPDPSLEIEGEHQAGQPMTFRLHGPAGAQGILYLGRVPEMIEDPTQYMDQRTSRERSYPLGSFPHGGVLEFTFDLPAWMWRGFAFHAQGEAVLPGGERRLTNSVPVVIRRLPER